MKEMLKIRIFIWHPSLQCRANTIDLTLPIQCRAPCWSWGWSLWSCVLSHLTSNIADQIKWICVPQHDVRELYENDLFICAWEKVFKDMTRVGHSLLSFSSAVCSHNAETPKHWHTWFRMSLSIPRSFKHHYVWEAVRVVCGNLPAFSTRFNNSIYWDAASKHKWEKMHIYTFCVLYVCKVYTFTLG